MSHRKRHQPSPSEVHYHEVTDPHRTSNSLSDIILGGQDGLVNVLGVILGVAAATQDSRIIMAAGLAATFAESVSMGAVAYTSTKADLAHYQAEKAREYRHLKNAPNIERQEIHDIFARKGFQGPLLDKIVETITADPETWVNIMLAEDYNLTETPASAPLRSAVIVFFAALIGSLIPLTPFFFTNVQAGILWSLGVSTVTLFAVGWYKARITVGSPARSGLEMAVIGMASALIGYGIGYLFQ